MSKIKVSQDVLNEENKPKKKQGLLAKVIIVMLGVGMAGFGTQSFGIGGRSANTALEVGSTVVTTQRLQQIRSDLKQQSPSLTDAQLDQFSLLRAKTELAMSNYITQGQFSVSDDQYLEMLSTNFAGVDGKFDRALYDRYVNATQSSEEQIKAQFGQQQFMQVISDSAIAVPEEVTPVIQMQQPKRDVELIRIDPAVKFADVVATDEEVQTYFDEYAKSFDIPEKIEVEYFDVDKSTIEVDETVTDSELNTAYEAYKKNNIDSEQRKSRYFLFGENKDVADKIASELKAGKLTWEDVEAQNKALIEEVGELDFTTKENADAPEIGEALFSIGEKGQTSDAIKTEFGYMILQLEDISASNSKTLADVKEQFTKEIIEQRRQEQFATTLEALEQAAFASDASFTTIQNALKLTPKSTGVVERTSQDGVLGLSQVAQALLDEHGDLHQVDAYIEPVEVNDNRIIVMNIKDYIPAKSQKLEDVKAKVEEAATADKRGKSVDALAKSMQEKLKSGSALADVAKENGLKVDKLSGLSFQNLPQGDDMIVGLQLLQKPIAIGVDKAQIIDTPTGGKALAVTTSATLAPLPDAEMVNSTADAFAQRIGQNDLENMIKAVIEDTDFKISSSVTKPAQ